MRAHTGLYSAIFLTIILLDRSTKWYALHAWSTEYRVTSFLSFVLTFNRGISWGLLSSPDTFFFILISSLIIAVTVGLTVSAYRRFRQNLPIYGEVLVIAGSCSNILDRFLYGGVIDFILVHAGNFSFPVFNCADCFVVLGVFFMAKELWETNA